MSSRVSRIRTTRPLRAPKIGPRTPTNRIKESVANLAMMGHDVRMSTNPKSWGYQWEFRADDSQVDGIGLWDVHMKIYPPDSTTPKYTNVMSVGTPKLDSLASQFVDAWLKWGWKRLTSKTDEL